MENDFFNGMPEDELRNLKIACIALTILIVILVAVALKAHENENKIPTPIMGVSVGTIERCEQVIINDTTFFSCPTYGLFQMEGFTTPDLMVSLDKGCKVDSPQFQNCTIKTSPSD